MINMRIGFGYDVHKLVEGRELWLGCVKIPHTLGLLGHSDADVLIHALADAMLGAAALGDIGIHFPENDPSCEGMAGEVLLSKTAEIIAKEGYKISNADTVIVCQKPKLFPHIPEMRERIAEILKTDIKNVSVKATTEEKMGFTGEEQGIKAYAVCLLEEV